MSRREEVMSALFALGAGLQWADPVSGQPITFAYADRRVKTFDEVAGQPAFMQAESDETITQLADLPYKQQLTARWVIYHNFANDKGNIGASMNNQIVDAIVCALTPTPMEYVLSPRKTLGGLAYRVWIDGKVFKDPGDLDGQALIIVPISILLPN